MALAASRDGLMVRVDPGTADDLVDGREVVPVRMRGREAAGPRPPGGDGRDPRGMGLPRGRVHPVPAAGLTGRLSCSPRRPPRPGAPPG
ncbi:MAG TPA: hypothetical protein VK038_04540 [Ornithinicoccus sp.]|nr:hypothetical protein [Ornithinicoccus sp.]